jgi:deoxyribodipyrimidine photolyase-related protein
MQGLMQRILYVAHDHLNSERGVLRTANPDTDVVVLVESARMVEGRPWHKERLFFLLSSARHFADSLKSAGFTVRYLQAATTLHGLTEVQAEFGRPTLSTSEMPLTQK